MNNMKKSARWIGLLLVASSITSPVHTWPQTQGGGAAGQVEDGVLRNIQGKVKADGDKFKFITDGDGMVWNVMNPETLKGYAGQHVQLNVHVYPSKSLIHVHSIKKLNN